MIALYIIGIYVLQVGYCILLVFAGKPETKRALIKGCGMPLMLSNWVMAFWAIAWVRLLLVGRMTVWTWGRPFTVQILQAFLIATICLGILLVLLLYANIVLLVYHVPTSKR